VTRAGPSGYSRRRRIAARVSPELVGGVLVILVLIVLAIAWRSGALQALLVTGS